MDDSITESEETVTITHSVSATADTTDYPTTLTVDSVSVTVTDNAASLVDNTAPGLVSASVAAIGLAVHLNFDEDLVVNVIPPDSAFTVKVQGNSRAPSSVSFAGAKIFRITSSPAIRPGETVTVSYTKPGTNPLQDAAGNEVASFTDQAVTNELAATAPAKPVNLTARAPSDDATKMVLTWETPWANGSDITKFQVRYIAGSTAGGTFADITGSGAATTSHTVTALTGGTEYTFEVRAVNDIGNGAESTVIARTAKAPGAPVLTAAAKDESIELEWTIADHGSSDITGVEYQIKETTGGTYSDWTDTGATASNTGGTATIGSLANGTEYTVQVRGVNAAGNGDASNEASATPDAPPEITSVEITSAPATANTYIIGEDIEFTVTFDKDLSLGGSRHHQGTGIHHSDGKLDYAHGHRKRGPARRPTARSAPTRRRSCAQDPIRESLSTTPTG